MLSRASRVELAIILLLAGTVLEFRERLPDQLSMGRLALVFAALLLAQGMVRDLWFWFRLRRVPSPQSSTRALCLCLESMVGLTALVVGAVLVFADLTRSFHLGAYFWPGFVFGTGVFGLLVKAYVFDFRKRRIMRADTHAEIIVG